MQMVLCAIPTQILTEKGDEDYTVPYYVNNAGNLAIKSNYDERWDMYNIIKISTDEIIMGTDTNGAILKKQ